MAGMTNGVLKFYDEKTQNWVVVETEPIAEKVVEIMRDDWLEHKGQLDCWLLKYTTEDDPNLPEPIYVELFVDSESVKNYDRDILEYYFKDYINALPNKKYFKLNEMIDYFKNTLFFELPLQFKLNIDLVLESGEFNFPEINSITNNVDIVYTLANQEKGTLTASYIYNGHAIPEKQFTYKANL
ncbi:hypothetical protein LPC11_08170 [Staphylococcus sp. HL28]|uniref:hypothetical protein n=1 Tax=Staphylococcus sp. HL28 TaxID=2897335 RepID=UPI001E4E5A6C|nr:hypothetical protein [Staphylococcus sp. HL28]UGB05404.1 hypothetical protein LPC11_08170 [Staphylococcus sp. HL28]